MIETFIKKGQSLQDYAIRYVSASIKQLPLPEKIKALAILKRYKHLAKISSEMFATLKEIEKRYIKLEEPLLNNVADLINGKRPLLQSELQDLPKYLNEEEIKQANQHLEARKIEGYWSVCLKNLSIVKDTIGNEDDALLQCIENIHVVDEEGGTDNFTIIFTIKPNDIIKNTQLTKKYYLEHDVPVKCQASPIEWVGKNLTLKQIKKKQKNKKTGQSRVTVKLVKNKSFFNFFTTIDVSSLSPNPAQLNEEELKLKEEIEDDFELGGMMVDDMLPYSLQYFLGIKHEEEEDMEGEDDQQQENEDEEQTDKKKPKKEKDSKSKSKSKSKGKGKKEQAQKAKPEQKPECKQQ